MIFLSQYQQLNLDTGKAIIPFNNSILSLISFDKKVGTDAIYFVFKKAFDSISFQEFLIYILDDYDLDYKAHLVKLNLLLLMIYFYLNDIVVKLYL